MIIGVVSYKGGVGKTTVVANLAAQFKRFIPVVNVVDLDDQNGLQLHFGLSPSLKDGIAVRGDVRNWQQVRFPTSSGVYVYPHGHLSPAQKLDFNSRMLYQPKMLNGWLKSLNLTSEECVLIDSPPGDNAAVRQVIESVDLLLVVLNSDGASFATLGLIEELVNELRPDLLSRGKVKHLLTNYDERRELDRAVREAVQRKCEESLSPVVIGYDNAIREALANCSLLSQYDNNSSVIGEFEALSQWLLRN